MSKQFTPQDIEDFFDEHKALQEAAEEACPDCKSDKLCDWHKLDDLSSDD